MSLVAKVLGRVLSPEKMAQQASQARTRSLEKSHQQGISGRPQLEAAMRSGDAYLQATDLTSASNRSVVEHFRALSKESALSTFAANFCQEGALRALASSGPELQSWAQSYNWIVSHPEISTSDRQHIALQTARSLQESSDSQVTEAGAWLQAATKGARDEQAQVALALMPGLDSLAERNTPAPFLSRLVAASEVSRETLQSVNQELLLLQISRHSDPSGKRLYQLAKSHPAQAGSLEKSLELQNALLQQFDPPTPNGPGQAPR